MKFKNKKMNIFGVVLVVFLLINFNAKANLGADINLDKKNLTPEQQEAKQMGEIFCEYCELGWVEKLYQEELYGYDMYGKKLSGDDFKTAYYGFIDGFPQSLNQDIKSYPSRFSPYRLPESCKSQSLKCLGDSVIKFKDKAKSYPDNISNKKLAEIQMPKYCFESSIILSVKALTQKDCNVNEKEAKGYYIVTNCEHIYQTINKDIYFLTPQEKQKYIDLMGYCAKTAGDYLRSEGAII